MNDIVSTQLIRQYVDGELDANEVAQIEQSIAQNPSLQAQVKFERALRESVDTSMRSACPAAPADLASQIRDAWADDSDVTSNAESQSPVVGRIDGSSQHEPAHRSRWAIPQQANLLMIAATLIIVTGVVLVSIYAPNIDQIGSSSSLISVADVAEFVSQEHGQCAHNSTHRQSKGHYRSSAEAETELTRHMGDRSVTVFDLGQSDVGYKFVGGGECGMPGGEPSSHLIYTRQPQTDENPGRAGPYASVFVEINTGQFDLDVDPGQLDFVPCNPGSTHQVAIFTKGDLVYFVVCCDMDDLAPITQAISQQLYGKNQSSAGW